MTAMRTYPPQNRPDAKGGFTLVEVLVVLLILMTLAGVVTVNVVRHRGESQVKAARIQIRQLQTALQTYRLEQNRYPTRRQGLDALVEKPGSPPVPSDYPPGGYLESDEVPLDPWGNPYIYLQPARNGQPYEIISYGQDGEPGGTGEAADISSTDLQ